MEAERIADWSVVAGPTVASAWRMVRQSAIHRAHIVHVLLAWLAARNGTLDERFSNLMKGSEG